MTSATLFPREHGAYAQLSLPLASALAVGNFAPGALALAAGAALVFLALEPIRVLLGHRGSRALREDAPRAHLRLAVLGLLGAGAAWVAASRAPADAWIAVTVPAAVGLAVATLLARREEKTTRGEVLAAVALSATALPVALAGGAAWAAALGIWLVWAVGFAAGTVAVRAMMERRGAPGLAPAVPALAAVGGGLAASASLAAAGAVPGTTPLAVAPLAVAAGLVAVLRWPPRRVRAAGWTLVGASLLAFAVVVGTFR